MALVVVFLFGDGLPGCDEGGGDECDHDVGVVVGAGVFGLEGVLVGDFGEVDSADIEQVGFVGHAPVVGAEAAVVVVECGGYGVVPTGYADHHK